MARQTIGQIALTGALWFVGSSAPAQFTRPEKPDDPLIFGVKNGISVALHPFGLDGRPQGGPRGLMRVGYEADGRYHLINYIAVEPLVGSVQGFSELETGGDNQTGKRFWVGGDRADGGVGVSGNRAGRIEETPAGRVLSFVLHVEPFANGARPVVEVSLFERSPDRVRFQTFAGAGGREMRRCVLTATMGNQSRCRSLWLRSGAVFAPTLYAGYSGSDFVEKQPYGLADLHQTKAGDVVAAVAPDEFEPSEVWPLPTNAWHQDGKWTTQFWLKRRGTYDQSLRCRVNGRRTYWGGDVPIPGGIAFENFEFREDFRPGQELWYGFTTESPARAFAFGYDASPQSSARREVTPAEATATAEAARNGRLLTNGDFAAGLTGWEAEGGARAFRTLTRGGATTLSTWGGRQEADTGRLFQCFQVPAAATDLQFTLHGGADARKTYVALWHGGRLYRRMTARDDNTPFRVRWDVTPLHRQVVTLEIVDESTEAWGFIGVGGFNLVQRK